jgi:hypothetical protein
MGLPYPVPSDPVHIHAQDHLDLVTRLEAIRLVGTATATFNWKHADPSTGVNTPEFALGVMTPSAAPFDGVALVTVCTELYIENDLAASSVGGVYCYTNSYAGGTPPGYGFNFGHPLWTINVPQSQHAWIGWPPFTCICPVGAGGKPDLQMRYGHGAGNYAGARGVAVCQYLPSTFATMPPS